MEKRGARRKVEEALAPAAQPPAQGSTARSDNPADEFRRMLKLSALDSDLTDDQRDALCNIGENLGLTGGQAEDLIDEYIDAMDGLPPMPLASAGRGAVVPNRPMVPVKKEVPPKKTVEQIAGKAVAAKISPLNRAQEMAKYPKFTNSLGIEMLLVPSGSFLMGSAAREAAPNEKPVNQVTQSCFFMSRFPVTNWQYQKFDPGHASKRAPHADDRHPVIYVTSIDASKFCEWLGSRDRKKYRLPTEAEWEYAARGLDGRSYPWGEKLERGDLANFADRNTNFLWSDYTIDDGYAETSPVGAYPRGVSPFGIEDMAGNVWEWCFDFFEAYKEKPRNNPRGPAVGTSRIYRGGSWKSRASSLRATARNFNMPDFSANDVGFRIVCECG